VYYPGGGLPEQGKVEAMPIVYDKLFVLLKEKGMKKQRLRTHEKYGIYAAGVDKLTKGKTIDTVTIGKLCALLECQPGDIMEYVPDE